MNAELRADIEALTETVPEALGGTPASFALRNAMSVALSRFGGSGGVLAALFSHNIGLPPVLQILGGMGYMRGTRSERIYREVKVMMIGGGAEEIMKDLAARQWGL